MQKANEQKNRKTATNYRTNLVKATCWILISIGASILIFSLILDSQTLAFIGLSSLFWGALLFYIQPEEYTKQVLLDSITPPSLETLGQMIEELDYKGKAIYLPPQYLKDPGKNKAYLPKRQNEQLPEPELFLNQQNTLFIKNPKGLLLTPPGAELTRLFEKRLGKSFLQMDLKAFKQNLSRLFVDDLEIAENLDIQIESSKHFNGKMGKKYGTFNIKISNLTFRDLVKGNIKLTKLYDTIGSPICSAIACALTKITGRPLIIATIQSSKNGKIIEYTYKIEELDYKEKAEAPLAEIIEFLTSPYHLWRLSGIFLAILGLLTLIWIGHLTLYELLVWSKPLDLILFTSRLGEPIDLGIGMKVINYFVIGSALLISGIITYLLKKRGEK